MTHFIALQRNTKEFYFHMIFGKMFPMDFNDVSKITKYKHKPNYKDKLKHNHKHNEIDNLEWGGSNMLSRKFRIISIYDLFTYAYKSFIPL